MEKKDLKRGYEILPENRVREQKGEAKGKKKGQKRKRDRFIKKPFLPRLLVAVLIISCFLVYSLTVEK